MINLVTHDGKAISVELDYACVPVRDPDWPNMPEPRRQDWDQVEMIGAAIGRGYSAFYLPLNRKFKHFYTACPMAWSLCRLRGQ